MKSKIAVFALFLASVSLSLSAHAQSFLTNGLIAYFPFDGNALDATTNGHNGTPFGSATFGVDRFGNSNACLALPGTAGVGSGVDVPSLAAMPYLPVTYSAWFLVKSYPPLPSGVLNIMTLVGREMCDQQDDGAVSICSAPVIFRTNVFNYFTGGNSSYCDVSPPTNQWCQVVCTISSNGMVSYYLNGTNMSIAGVASVSSGAAEDFRIGASASGGSGCDYQYVWNGLIDDVRIYNRALASNEVQSLYEVEAPQCLPSPALASATETNGFVVAINLLESGCGYTNTPLVALVGGGGTGAGAYAIVTNGFVTAIELTNAGFGYTSAPQVIIGNVPAIVAPPVSTNVDAFSPASFSVATTGTSFVSYQWLFDGAPIAGATSNQLTFSNVVETNLGSYSVIVTNVFGSVTSSIAVLGMYPYLNQSFAGFETDWGYTNTLSVDAWGTGPLSYQWYFDGSAIAGATGSNYTLSSIQFTNAGLYSVVVSDALGSVTNTPEQVVVNPSGVSIGLSPTVTITGVVGYTYAIQRNDSLANTNTWTTITNITLTQPVEIWADTSINTAIPGNSQQFYRVLPGQ